MKKLLLNEDFEKIEQTCLFLDLLIDCELYKEFDDQISKLKNSYKFGILLPDLEEGNGNNKLIGDYIKKNSEIQNNSDINLFEIIITSKLIRRLIKEEKKGEEKKLSLKVIKTHYKDLTEELIKKIPPRSEVYSNRVNRGNQFRIIFLNEISACSEGDLAIGYADIALDELQKLNKNWNLEENGRDIIKHPYELYALYNKGLAYLHDHRNQDQAIKTLEQITLSFESIDKKNETIEFKKEYCDKPNLKDMYLFYFWFLYVPSKNLIAEAYSDLFSSFDLEKTVKGAIDRIQKEKGMLFKMFSKRQNKEYINKIKMYFKARFNIQLIFSAIDKRDKQVFKEECVIEDEWLNNFQKILCDIEIKVFREYIEKSPLDGQLAGQLDSAKALFFLEHTRMFNVPKENIKISICVCDERLKRKCDPDWSDFACTFLECVIFALENDIIDPLNNKDDTEPILFLDQYKKISKKINNPEWIPRKKDLVEKFLKCQEEILKQYKKHIKLDSNKKGGDEKINKYMNFQFDLIINILSEDSERRFKKRWSECEKEKLVKNFKDIVRCCFNGNVKEWWEGTKNNFKKEYNGIDIYKNIDEISKNEKYRLPEKKETDSVKKFIKEKLNCDYYTKKLRLNAEQFYDHLIYQSCRPSFNDCYGLTVLRRWQSFTPALSMGSEVGHKGGGYFVYKTNSKGEIDEGLVIDPGFDFLENFFDEGFSIRDINAVLITHSHRDHSSDFMSIVNLFHEMNKRGKRVFQDRKWKERKLLLILTEGCHQNFAEQISRNRETFHEVIGVHNQIKYPENKNKNSKGFLEHFQLEVTKANHHDQSDHDSVGYVIKDNSGKTLIGFTGDTQWYNKIEDAYEDCPVICMNIGGIVDIHKEGNLTLSDLCSDKNNAYHENIKTILLRENHLYLPGFYLMAKKLNKKTQKLLILSELCEEMKGGLRTDLADKVHLALRIPVLPEDIGLTINLSSMERGYVLCKACNKLHKPDQIIPVETDRDNAIVYLCKKHYNQLKEDSIIPKINELELEKDELHKPLSE